MPVKCLFMLVKCLLAFGKSSFYQYEKIINMMILIWYNYFLHIFNILKKYCIFANEILLIV